MGEKRGREGFSKDSGENPSRPLFSRPVQRVAVIGPGLDVIDKQEGDDCYLPQTIQPFAVVDSLVRTGLADARTIRVTTFDVNIADMLRPGGLLLSNNALVEVPPAGMRSIGYSKTLYSNRDEDGDLIIWYQKGLK